MKINSKYLFVVEEVLFQYGFERIKYDCDEVARYHLDGILVLIKAGEPLEVFPSRRGDWWKEIEAAVLHGIQLVNTASTDNRGVDDES